MFLSRSHSKSLANCSTLQGKYPNHSNYDRYNRWGNTSHTFQLLQALDKQFLWPITTEATAIFWIWDTVNPDHAD